MNKYSSILTTTTIYIYMYIWYGIKLKLTKPTFTDNKMYFFYYFIY